MIWTETFYVCDLGLKVFQAHHVIWLANFLCQVACQFFSFLSHFLHAFSENMGRKLRFFVRKLKSKPNDLSQLDLQTAQEYGFSKISGKDEFVILSESGRLEKKSLWHHKFYYSQSYQLQHSQCCAAWQTKLKLAVLSISILMIM